MNISPRSINENTNSFNMTLCEDMKIYRPQYYELDINNKEKEYYNNINNINNLNINNINNNNNNNNNDYNINHNNMNNYYFNSYYYHKEEENIEIHVNIHEQEEYDENDLRYYLVRFKRSSQWMWLPYSILPSSISEGDFVVCRTMNGLNIGVVIETSLDGNISNSHCNNNGYNNSCYNNYQNNNNNNNYNYNNNQYQQNQYQQYNQYQHQNENENNDLDNCGEIMGLATCEQMESFQGKLKKESNMLDICREYLTDIQQDQVIRLLDVEFEMDGSLNLYYSANESFTNNQFHCLQVSLQLFLSKMKFHLIRITNPCLLLSCKSINDLVTCPSISSMTYSCNQSQFQQQHHQYHHNQYHNQYYTHSSYEVSYNQSISIQSNEQFLDVYEECNVILELPQFIKDKQSKNKSMNNIRV